MNNIKFGIIGHGFMGREHEKMLSEFDGIEITAIADCDPKQLDGIDYPVEIYSSADELLKNGDIDVVIIAANNKPAS